MFNFEKFDIPNYSNNFNNSKVLNNFIYLKYFKNLNILLQIKCNFITQNVEIVRNVLHSTN